MVKLVIRQVNCTHLTFSQAYIIPRFALKPTHTHHYDDGRHIIVKLILYLHIELIVGLIILLQKYYDRK